MWYGEAFYGLQVQGVGVLPIPGGFFPFSSAKCGFRFSGRFLIHRAHAVYFLPLVTILDLVVIPDI
jgi:hypothetical protein